MSWKSDMSIHPLLVPVVLEQVFQCMSFKDLVSASQVCRQWHSAFLRECSLRPRIQFNSLQELEKFTRFVKNKTKDSFHFSLCTHVQLLKVAIEFQSFSVDSCFFLHTFCDTIRTLEIDHGSEPQRCSEIFEFIQLAGLSKANFTKLETLILSGSHISPGDLKSPLFTCDLTPDEFQYLPSVKSLKILPNGERIPCPDWLLDGVRFLKELFQALPNLESLTFLNYPFLFIFKLALDNEYILLPSKKITSLHIEMWNGYGISEFKEKGYTLKSLKLDVHKSLSRTDLHTLISSQGRSLEALEIIFVQADGEWNLRTDNTTSFPSALYMKSLKYLRLVGFRGNLCFLKDIPSLTKVDIERMQFNIAFPLWLEDEDLLTKRVRDIITFRDETGKYCKI